MLNAELRDEVFIQIIKQLRDNPSTGSLERGWALLLVCLDSFPPSEDAENYIEHFLRSRNMKPCVVALHRSLFRGPLTFPPEVPLVEAALKAAAAKLEFAASSTAAPSSSSAASVAVSSSPSSSSSSSSSSSAAPSTAPSSVAPAAATGGATSSVPRRPSTAATASGGATTKPAGFSSLSVSAVTAAFLSGVLTGPLPDVDAALKAGGRDSGSDSDDGYQDDAVYK